MSTCKKNILVTGANKGIGEAIVRKLLDEHDDVVVLLGSRSERNGLTTKEQIVKDIPKSSGRVEVLVLDVSDDTSVMEAAQVVKDNNYSPLYGIVNNAGIMGSSNYTDVLNVNFMGIKRMFESFSPLLVTHGGRIVNVTSAAGPNFVAKMEPGPFKRQLVSKSVTWDNIEDIYDGYISVRDTPSEHHVFGNLNNTYGMSKALANAYTLLLARENPHLLINACTPGMIATDMTGKKVGEFGAKSPACGACAPCHLLFDIDTSGRYYGSDGLRSPFHKYRSPGDDEYESEPDDEKPASR